MSENGFEWGGFGRPGYVGGWSAARRGPARAGKGDVQAAVLSLLSESDMHGYQLMQELAARSGGAWRPGGGSIYPTLRQLEEQGLIEGRSEGAKQVFRLTDAGRAAVQDAGSPAPWEERALADAPRLALRDDLGALMSAAGMVEQSGADAQVEKARGILRRARRSLFLVLADDDEAPEVTQ